MTNPQDIDRSSLPRRTIGELQSGQCAVYYRDGSEGVWVKFSKTHHFPASFEQGKCRQTGQNQPLAPDETVSVLQNIEDLTGSTFTVEVPVGKSLEQFRAETEAEFDHKIHIKATIGPARVEGRKTVFPIRPVDDQFLQGNFSRLPQHGGMLVIGYFK